MIVSIFGQPGSGKTTHSSLLSEYFRNRGILNFSIDGDDLRKLFKNDVTFIDTTNDIKVVQQRILDIVVLHEHK